MLPEDDRVRVARLTDIARCFGYKLTPNRAEQKVVQRNDKIRMINPSRSLRRKPPQGLEPWTPALRKLCSTD
jgi:hypothetical protein